MHCAHECRQQRINDPIGRAEAHDFEQQETGEARSISLGKCKPGNLQCLLSEHVGDIKSRARKPVADLLLSHLNESAGQCKADCGAFFNIGVQHEHSPGVVFTHRCVYVDSIQRVKSDLYAEKDDESLCGVVCHEAYGSVLGAVAWAVLTGAELAVYVQASQRRAHAPRVTDCKMLNLVIGHMKKHNCGLKGVCLKHPLKLVSFIDAVFKAQPDEPIGLALRGVVAI